MQRPETDIVVINKTKGKPARLPFALFKRAILGKRYRLEVILVQPKESRTINFTYRKKNKPANVLSFSLSTLSGQIVLCPHQAAQDAEKFQRKTEDFMGFLFIHGLLHLKGYRHGSTMESEEKRLSARFLSS